MKSKFNIDSLYREIREGRQPHILFLQGEENYPIDMTIALAKSLVDIPDLGVTEFKGVFTDDEAETALQTPPMMGEYRLVIFNRTGFFKWLKTEKLLNLFASLPEFVKVIIYETEFKKNTKIYKRVDKYAEVVVSDKRSARQLESWLSGLFQKQQIKLETGALKNIVRTGGSGGMYALANAAEYFFSVGSFVTNEDVKNYFQIPSESDFFEIYRIFGTEAMITYVRKVTDAGEPVLRLFHTIGNFLRAMYKVKILGGDAQAKEIAGLTDFIFRNARLHAAEFTVSHLADLVRIFEKADITLKSSFASDVSVLESCCIKIINARKKSCKGSAHVV